jgi:predicted phosphodiesterase
MRVALISDLHGNEVALEAVLADIGRHGVDRIVCLGDTATLGPRPEAVLARLRDLGCPCIVGNHDAFMLDPELIRSYRETPQIVLDSVDWCRDRLSTQDLDFIRSFVPTLDLELGAGARLFLFHGTPRSHMEDLLCTTPPAQLDEMLGGHTATVMACGHTHIQMLRQHRGTLIVNPGSVGLSFEQHVDGKAPTLLPYGEWASVEANDVGVEVRLHRVHLDRAAMRAAAAASKLPLSPMLVDSYS